MKLRPTQEAYRHHYKLGLPELPAYLTEGIMPLEWTKHASIAAAEDGILTRFETLNLSRCVIIKTGHSTDGTLIKVLYKTALNGLHDICFAVVPYSNKLTVKTFFVNATSDRHETLDVSKYRKLID